MLYNATSLDRFENVTIPVGTGGTQFNFPDQPNLRNVPITGMSVYWQMTATPQGATLPDISTLTESFLVLYVNNDEYVRIPVAHLISTYTATPNNTGSTFPVNSNGYIPLGGLRVIWSKSYVKVPAGYAPGANYAFMFGVFYNK